VRIELKSGHRTARRGGQRSGGPLVVHQQRSLGTERERFRTEFSDGMLTLYQDEMPIIYRDEAVILLPGAIGALHARPPTAEHVAIEAAVRAPSSSTRVRRRVIEDGEFIAPLRFEDPSSIDHGAMSRAATRSARSATPSRWT